MCFHFPAFSSDVDITLILCGFYTAQRICILTLAYFMCTSEYSYLVYLDDLKVRIYCAMLIIISSATGKWYWYVFCVRSYINITAIL